MRARLSKVLVTALVAGTLTTSILAGGPAGAVFTDDCGGTYINGESCQLNFAGPHLVVFVANNTGTPVTVSIRDPLSRTLLGCTSGRGTCSAEANDTTLPTASLTMLAGVPLTCFVQGGSGSYNCMSETV